MSDAVRKYLGGRYGFDGLETTTGEMTSILKRVEPPVVELAVDPRSSSTTAIS